MEGGILKVVRGALVAMKGIRKGNIFFLDGSIIIGRVIVSNTSDGSDTFKLWHMQLGYAGEKVL